ncbi:alpha/beta fold hydrolase [Alloalcanivorax sp. C16-1]|uniref:alpha/beta fold hydrolase n=1 Tax=Alloalcanivorax sp. C16-1 TaxID=3390051 RepID=UPI0039708F5F
MPGNGASDPSAVGITTWILLRGLVREQAHWNGFAERLAGALGTGHRVLPVDLPGNGVLHRQASPTRVAGMVARLRETLREQGVHGPVRLVALSLGGMVAVEWLRHHPEEIAAAALINSSAAPFSPFWRRLRPRNYGRIVFQGLLARDREARERMILELTTNHLSAEQRARIAEGFATVNALRPVSAANTVRQLWAAARFRAPRTLPAGAPVLIVNGAGDRLVHPDCSRALARAWQCPLAVHPDGGHDLSLDAPDWLATTLAAWGPGDQERDDQEAPPR